jgi:hypothetical protein
MAAQQPLHPPSCTDSVVTDPLRTLAMDMKGTHLIDGTPRVTAQDAHKVFTPLGVCDV